MGSHGRSRSKGSFSILSDTIRSFNRAGSRQASRIPSRDELHGRSQSSLSYRCDPHNQPPASPEPSSIRPAAAVSPGLGSPEKMEKHVKDEGVEEEADSAVPELHHIRRRTYRSRPLSWLPFSRSSSRSRYPRSLSFQLPKASSTSTVARSVISAPILTSTTNADVARDEGVHYEEITDLAVSQSNWGSHVGSIAKIEEDGQGKGDSSHTADDKRLFSERRNPSTNMPVSTRARIMRFGDAIKSRIRSGPSRTQTSGDQLKPSEATGEILSQTLERGMSRRAETLNLYKGKFKGLTGNGHTRRKSVNASKDAAAPSKDPPLLGDDIIGALPDTNGDQSDNDSTFGSLTRSFASAVEKLDFYTPLPRNNMSSFLRSKSSTFFSKKGEKGDKDSGDRGDAKRPFPTISPPQPISTPQLILPATQAPSPASPSKPTLPAGPLDATLSSKSDEPLGSTGHRPLGRPPVPQGYGPSPTGLASRQSVPSPVVFSDEKNKYVPTSPAPGYPRGVNPLRMHPPDTMAWAPSRPYRPQMRAGALDSDAPPVVPRRQVETPRRDSEDDDSTGSLEDAPIYSPSLGDLSQYARDTPPSTKSGRSEVPPSSIMGGTPTRSIARENAPVGGERGFLRKTKSGLGLFTRGKPDKTSTAASEGASLAASSTGSPLSQRDNNQKAEKSVKKSRSLHFTGLFKRESHSDLPPPMPPAPFQPATPSPLRNVTRARGDNGSQSTATDDQSPGLRAAKK